MQSLRQGLDWEVDIRRLNKLFLTDWEEQSVLRRETNPSDSWLHYFGFCGFHIWMTGRWQVARNVPKPGAVQASINQQNGGKSKLVMTGEWLYFNKNKKQKLNCSYWQTIFRHLHIRPYYVFSGNVNQVSAGLMRNQTRSSHY